MDAKCFTLRIITPEREIFNDQIESAIMPGSEGQLGILANHAPLVTRLKKGIVYIEYADGKCIDVDIEEGYARVRNNIVIVLATSASMFTEPDITPKINQG